MPTLQTVVLCLCHILFVKVFQTAGDNYTFKDIVTYDVSKYFFNTSYQCFFGNIFPDGKMRAHIRRCKMNYQYFEDTSPSCLFCPIPCSLCANPLTHYTYGSFRQAYWGAGNKDRYSCHFHSLHAIEPRIIRARKGVTVKDDVKCVIKDHCKSSPCKNQGKCVKLYYSYTCICTKNYYGKNCDKEAGTFAGKLTYGVQLWFPLQVISGRLFPFFVTVAHEGEDQLIELTTVNNYLIRLRPSDKINDFANRCSGSKCRCDPKENCKSAYKGTLVSDSFYLKRHFLNLPVLFDNLHAVSFVTNVTIKVFNEKFNPTEPVYQETIDSFNLLRLQTFYFTNIHPSCDCQILSSTYSVQSSPNVCSPKFSNRPKIRPDVKALFSFDLMFLEFGWRVFKKQMDKMDEMGETKKEKPPVCALSTLKAHWRFYKVNGLYQLTDNMQDNKQLEIPNVCTEKALHKDVNNACDAKFNKMESGDYVLRLTTQSYRWSKAEKNYLDNSQHNYYCYFTLMDKKPKKLTIVGNATIEACNASIDTKGYEPGEGKLIWTCKALKGGPCPSNIIVNDKPYLDRTEFLEGEYEICVAWEVDGQQVGRPCVKVVCKKEEPEKHKDLIVDCKENCGTYLDPNVPVRLGVIDRVTGEPPLSKITWEMRDADGNLVKLEDFTIPEGVRTNEIKIDVKKLKPNVVYSIIGRDEENDTSIPYVIEYIPREVPTDGNCTMTPKSGMKGFTLFDITCFGWQSEGPILYEFFDKGLEDVEHYQGRMTGYSYSGMLTQFRLTRGNVVIYLLNEDGDGPSVNITVQLTDFDRNMSHIQYLMDEIDDYMGYNNYQPTLDIMSTLAEILYMDMNNEYYIRRIISTMAKIEIDSAEGMKLGLSTILSVLVNGTLKGTYLLDDILEMYTGRILLQIAQVYLKYATKPDHTPRLRAQHVHQLSRNIMDCVDMSMIAQDKNVTKLEPEENIGYDVMDNLGVASNDIAEALMIAMYLVGRVQPYAAEGRQIMSSESVSDMYAYVNNAGGLVNVAGSNISSFVNMSQNLANTFNENHDIMLQFTFMKKNLFWWAQNNINTELIMVGLAERLYRPGYYYVPKVDSPVQIFMKVKKMVKTTIRGNATQLDPALGSDTLDKIILVHRFILPPLSKLFVSFKFDGNNSASALRVLVNFNERPNWEDMAGAKVISSEKPHVVVPYDVVEREHFYYMGILPDKNVPVNSTVEYTFDLHFVNCHIWENQWINHYCLVGPRTSEETVECQCTHMSIFSGSIFVPPNDINPILDAPLFLTVLENPWVVAFVILILLLFLILLLWAYRKDKIDALCSDVIVLHDNFPGENYAYLIAIFTGSRLTSGTSATVGLRLYGDTYASRPAVLKCDSRKVLQRDNDDWFLLCYPVSLGILNAVQLWHDNAGRSPDWYCSKIIVYDLHAMTQYLFIVDQWLAMEIDEFPEAMVRPATTDEVLSVKRIFLDNSVLGFRENHLHLSVLARHPRSPVARKQRLVVLMVLIMSAMLTSIMFFKVSDKFAEDVDAYHYSFGQREFMISIQSLVISTIFAFIAMFLFRKGYKQKETPKIHSTLFMPRKRSSITDKYWSSDKPAFVDLSTFIAYDEKPPKQRKDMTMYESLILAIKHCTHQKTLRPVHLASKGSEIKVNKGWLIAAWVFSVLVIIICAYLVMLYSLKFGKVKSLMWLSCLVATQAHDIFLFTPLKILFVAMLLSAAFERTTDISSFKLNVNEAVKQDLIGNKQYLEDLTESREKSIYYPMADEVKAKKRRKAMRKMKWRIILDFLAVLAFILILCLIMKTLWSGAHFYPNDHAAELMMTKYNGRFVALHDVFNRTQFFSFLQNTFVRSLFVFRWFNDLNFGTLSPPEDLERKDWTKDFVSKMVGAPRLRQLRVVADLCTIHQMMVVAVKKCYRPWSRSDMDTDTYGSQWQKADLDDEIAYAFGYRTYWMYQEPKNTSVFPLSGKSGIIYPSGGYILPLAVKREISKSYAIEVEQEHWVDQRMRAVFLELTLYNVNNHLFTQVTAIIEQMTSGLFMTAVNVDSVHTREDFSVWNDIYIIFIVALALRIVYKMNRNGLLNFFKKFLNLYEVLVITVGVLSVVCYLIHTKVSTIYVEEFHRGGLDLFFNFEEMIKYFRYTKALLWLLFCLLVFRLFVSWYFGKRYIYYYHTITLSKRWIIILMFFWIFYFYIIWRMIGYTIDAKVFHNSRVNILHYKMYDSIYKRDFHDRTKLIAFLLCLMALFFKILFFVTFTHYFKIGKRTKLNPMQYFNFLTFVVDEVKRISGKKKDDELKTDRQIHRKRDVNIPRK